jgi:hypothetical protein
MNVNRRESVQENRLPVQCKYYPSASIFIFLTCAVT